MVVDSFIVWRKNILFRIFVVKEGFEEMLLSNCSRNILLWLDLSVAESRWTLGYLVTYLRSTSLFLQNVSDTTLQIERRMKRWENSVEASFFASKPASSTVAVFK